MDDSVLVNKILSNDISLPKQPGRQDASTFPKKVVRERDSSREWLKEIVWYPSRYMLRVASPFIPNTSMSVKCRASWLALKSLRAQERPSILDELIYPLLRN